MSVQDIYGLAPDCPTTRPASWDRTTRSTRSAAQNAASAATQLAANLRAANSLGLDGMTFANNVNATLLEMNMQRKG